MHVRGSCKRVDSPATMSCAARVLLSRFLSPMLRVQGQELLDCVGSQLQRFPTQSSGQRKPFVLQTVEADDQ